MPGEQANALTVGMCQVMQGYDFEQNLARTLDMVDEAVGRGAQIVTLTEMFFTPYEPAAIKRSAPLAREALEKLQESAARNRVMIVAGSMPWETGGPKLYNRAHVIDARGEVIHRHDKIHLFDCTPPGGPAVRESDAIMPGSTLGTFETPWGRAAVVVCYDIRFSPLTQLLVDEGVRLLFVPAAFSLSTGTAHWEMLVRIRAVELQGFVVGVQPARNQDLRYVPFGHSLAASPWGEILADAGEGESVTLVRFELDQVQAIRERFPLAEHRRTDLYHTRWRGGE